MDGKRQYLAIDLKSFYASVECVERRLDPLDTCLVVADSSRTQKTICLAVSPALKKYGTGGRPRLFEVMEKVRSANIRRGKMGKSSSAEFLDKNPQYEIDFIIAPPRMALYIEYSARIYEIYLNFVAPEDIHVYSIDEVFIDITSYLVATGLSARQMSLNILASIFEQTGITATVGIGTNLYLAKVAMDIVAKKLPPDKNGARIAELDEFSYRRDLWSHIPLSDFWRVGAGTVKRLSKVGIFTMGDVAKVSLQNEDLLYDLFGVNAELLIDHAWGWEPVTLKHIKDYRPDSKSICSGQVLQIPYNFENARTVVQEMADAVSFDLIEKGVVTNQIVLTVGYDVESLSSGVLQNSYSGVVRIDRYGRKVPTHAHGTANIDQFTSSSMIITDKIVNLFNRIVNPDLLVRRITITLNNIITEYESSHIKLVSQPSLFDDMDEFQSPDKKLENKELAKEKKAREAMLEIRKKFGKNAILRGLNYADGATQRDRNMQIGGHHK